MPQPVRDFYDKKNDKQIITDDWFAKCKHGDISGDLEDVQISNFLSDIPRTPCEFDINDEYMIRSDKWCKDEPGKWLKYWVRVGRLAPSLEELHRSIELTRVTFPRKLQTNRETDCEGTDQEYMESQLQPKKVPSKLKPGQLNKMKVAASKLANDNMASQVSKFRNAPSSSKSLAPSSSRTSASSNGKQTSRPNLIKSKPVPSSNFGKKAVLQMVKPTIGIEAFEKQQLVNCSGKDSAWKRTASPPGKQPSPKKRNAASSPSLRPLKPHDQSTDIIIDIAKTSKNIVTNDPQVTLQTSQTATDSTSNMDFPCSVTDDSTQINSTIIYDNYVTEAPSSDHCKVVILEGDNLQAMKSYSFDSAYKSCSAFSGNEQQPRTSDSKDEENERLRAQVQLLSQLLAADDGKAATALLMNKLDRVEGQLSNMSGRLDNVESKLPNLDKYCKVAQWLDKSDFTSSIESFCASHSL